MQNRKKDESVKTGLETEAHRVTKDSSEKDATKDLEKDADELVHEQIDMPEDTAGKDPDDLVHSHPTKTVADEMTERDPDDLVHENGIDVIEEG